MDKKIIGNSRDILLSTQAPLLPQGQGCCWEDILQRLFPAPPGIKVWVAEPIPPAGPSEPLPSFHKQDTQQWRRLWGWGRLEWTEAATLLQRSKQPAHRAYLPPQLDKKSISTVFEPRYNVGSLTTATAAHSDWQAYLNVFKRPNTWFLSLLPWWQFTVCGKNRSFVGSELTKSSIYWVNYSIWSRVS